jgi:bifunctional UDP-N-acetylglucosamine pyrophosphorylase/glucosamine-1-phosphate N-acetyltransferase
MSLNLNVVILAAGQGKRMYSKLPKVLHKIGDKPLLQHVIATAVQLKPNKVIIIYGHGGEVVKNTIDTALLNINHDNPANIIWVKQDAQLGTGHALQCAVPYLDSIYNANKNGNADDSATLVLYGDVPLISAATLQLMLNKYENSNNSGNKNNNINNIVMLTAEVDNPTGYGRVVRNELSEIVRVVEQKDAAPHEHLICEINTGFYALPTKNLATWLQQLSNNNQQNEYYLTDVIGIAAENNTIIDYLSVKDHAEILGVNNKVQLEQVERLYQRRVVNQLLESGLTVLDKSRIDIRGTLKHGMDCIIDVNCIFVGSVELGDNVTIGAGCIIKDTTIGHNVTIKPYTVIEGVVSIGDNCQIGPFSRIRPDANIEPDAHIGNFVEIKKSKIGRGSKVNHLTYIGDAVIGERVNVGAGSVTCNYDGVNKSQTTIEDNVFIGSGTMMIAPVVIRAGGVIGAGSTITRDTEPNELTVARSKQVTVKGWVKRYKK